MKSPTENESCSTTVSAVQSMMIALREMTLSTFTEANLTYIKLAVNGNIREVYRWLPKCNIPP